MNMKKTRFSYILWLIATGFSVLFIFDSVQNIPALNGAESLDRSIGYGTGFLVLISGVFLLLFMLQKKISFPVLSDTVKKGLHIIIFFGLVALFTSTRIQSAIYLPLKSQQVINLYEASIIDASVQQAESFSSYFEQIYSNILSVLFLFLGNNKIVMFYFQLFLQTASFLFLIVIGWILQKNFFAWIPSAFYTVFPLFVDAASDMGVANFLFCIITFIIAVIGIFANRRKNNMITYIAISVTGILYGVLIFVNDSYSFLSEKNMSYADTEQSLAINMPPYFLGELFLGVALIFYCISFWYQDTDYASLCLIPAIEFVLLCISLNGGYDENKKLLLMLMNLFLFFVVSEGMSMFFTKKRRTFANDNSALKEEMHEKLEPQWDTLAEKKKMLPPQPEKVKELSESDYQLTNSFEPLAEKSTEKIMEPVAENTSVNEFEPLEDMKKKAAPEMEISPVAEADTEKASKSAGFKWWENETGMEQQESVANTQEVVSEPSDSQVIFFEDIDIEEIIPEKSSDTSEISEASDTTADPEAEKQQEINASGELQKVDKTAMIENVLPMPKKHVSRTLEYAFDPSEDMMHYDVEIENDDYDYE